MHVPQFHKHSGEWEGIQEAVAALDVLTAFAAFAAAAEGPCCRPTFVPHGTHPGVLSSQDKERPTFRLMVAATVVVALQVVTIQVAAIQLCRRKHACRLYIEHDRALMNRHGFMFGSVLVRQHSVVRIHFHCDNDVRLLISWKHVASGSTTYEHIMSIAVNSFPLYDTCATGHTCTRPMGKEHVSHSLLFWFPGVRLSPLSVAGC